MPDRSFYHIILIVFLIYVAGVAIYVSYGLAQINQKSVSNQWFFYTMGDKMYKLRIADNPALWSKGLSGIKEVPTDYDGMIFIFPNKQIRPFWNQGTYVNLHLLWMQDFAIVQENDLHSIVNGLQIVTPEEPVNYVIEIFERY